jgi:hypothetical protein
MRKLHVLRSLAAAILCVFVFAGGFCEVRYCSDGDCDPCTTVCKCHTTCSRALAPDFESAHRLAAYTLALERHPDGTWTRTIGAIAGLSVDRALGPGPHDARDLELFARNVVAANERLLGRPGEWRLASLERAAGACVSTFVAADERSDAVLVFLFDRAGALVEIARHGSS